MLNLAHACISDEANGPGRRFTVWTQGCQLGCPGCFNPGLQPVVPRRAVSPRDLAREAVAAGPWEGISLSGGEPFLQAGALVRFLDELRSLVAPFATIVFSGYRVEELRARGGAATELIERVDLVVDGPYLRERASALPLRGSQNQRLVALTPAGQALRERVERQPSAGCEVRIGDDGAVILTGFPPADLVQRVLRLSGQTGRGAQG